MELGLPGQQPVGTGRMPPDLSRQQAAGKGGCWLVLFLYVFEYSQAPHTRSRFVRALDGALNSVCFPHLQKMVTDDFPLLCVLCSSIGRVASGEK